MRKTLAFLARNNTMITVGLLGVAVTVHGVIGLMSLLVEKEAVDEATRYTEAEVNR
jgi:hypothetical protein